MIKLLSSGKNAKKLMKFLMELKLFKPPSNSMKSKNYIDLLINIKLLISICKKKSIKLMILD